MWRRIKTWFLLLGFQILRAIWPVIRLGKRPLVFRHKDVVSVLDRNDEFSVIAIYAEKMLHTSGDFFLGMDDGDTYQREAAIVRGVVRAGDLATIRAFVRREAEQIVEAKRANGLIDVVGDLGRIVPTRFCGEYLGVPGPNEITMQVWMRVIFWHLFVNIDNEERVRAVAEEAAGELNPYVAQLIQERKKSLEDGSWSGDDLLTRLIALQGGDAPSLDDAGIRRNISGLILGAIDTTNKAVAHALQSLLDRPSALAGARAAAEEDDMDLLTHYAYEALRFQPFASGMVRHSPAESTIGGKRIAAGKQVVLVTHSAMFDKAAFPSPKSFRADRALDSYLHFGRSFHLCFGNALNRVQIPELLRPLVMLPGLCEASKMTYDGPFPDRYLVSFDV